MGMTRHAPKPIERQKAADRGSSALPAAWVFEDTSRIITYTARREGLSE
jgi:hypothetical protein